MSFYDDEKLEIQFYEKYFKPYLIKNGYSSIFARYIRDREGYIGNELQFKDIDMILDNKEKNISLSLKIVKGIYDNVFIKTISNTEKQTKGWFYYSKADYIIYVIGFPKEMKVIKFSLIDLENVYFPNYKTAFGETFKSTGESMFQSEGKLIPLADFKHEVLDIKVVNYV